MQKQAKLITYGLLLGWSTYLIMWLAFFLNIVAVYALEIFAD